jgi:hypothetical protein
MGERAAAALRDALRAPLRTATENRRIRGLT